MYCCGNQDMHIFWKKLRILQKKKNTTTQILIDKIFNFLKNLIQNFNISSSTMLTSRTRKHDQTVPVTLKFSSRWSKLTPPAKMALALGLGAVLLPTCTFIITFIGIKNQRLNFCSIAVLQIFDCDMFSFLIGALYETFI